MKNLSKVLALVLVVAMVFSLAVSAGAAVSFKDDASVNYDEAVQLLAALDVINGYDTDGDGKGDTFKPGNAITRAELTVMLSYLVANEDSEYGLYNDITKLNKDYKSLCTFADSKDHYAAGFIAFCYGNGYISGRNADTFDPAGNVTVAEATVMLLRVMGYDAAKEEFGTSANTVKGYNLQLTARNAGLLDGLTDVDFFAPATREVVAQLFLNALDSNVVAYTAAGARYFETIDVYTDGTYKSTEYKTLVNECFQHVVKKDTANEYGYAGHQWVTYGTWTPQTNALTGVVSYHWAGGTTALTDVFVDDVVVVEFKGGTTYADIAKALGITSATSTLNSKAYVNGQEVTNNSSFAAKLPGTAATGYGTLNAIYAAAYSTTSMGKALADNCTLRVIRDYDRSVGGTYYKLMYYFEFLGEVVNVALVNNPMSPRFGQYQYTFVYYKNNTEYPEYVYAATADAYVPGTYYIVVPNESTLASGSNFPNVSEYKEFLSVSVAKTFAPFVATTGTSDTFMLNTKISDGKNVHYVSANIKDFTNAADYNKALTLIFNTAGYVAGYEKVASSILETGYVYVDSVEFSVTTAAGAQWINQYAPAWSAQAKAQVYFPAVGGNSNYSVIDLSINSRTKQIAIASANDMTISAVQSKDSYVEQNFIQLDAQQTKAFYDLTGTEYTWTNNNSNIRVYDKWFDGWYAYTKNTDGTYSLAPVAKEQVGIVNGNANVVAASTTDTYDAYKLTSSTEVYTYTMDMNTMTCSAVLQTAYKGIKTGTYGNDTGAYEADAFGTEYTMPFYGVVGGKVTANALTSTISKVEEFKTVRATNKYAYSLFKGTTDYSSAYGYGLKFFAAGATEVLYLADEVTIIGSGPLTVSADTALTWIANNAVDNANCYELYLDPVTGVIVQVKRIALTKVEDVYAVDLNGYIRPTNVADANNYNTANVWNVNTGAADAPAKGDTVYYVAGTTIPVMWVYTPGEINYGTPNWNTPNNGSFPWWA